MDGTSQTAASAGTTCPTDAGVDAPRASDATPYPPEPWHLGGHMDLSLWRVPPDDLPGSFAAARPRGARPVVIGGYALVGAAFVTYTPGGVLAYDELLVAMLTWHRSRPRVTISDIWVDSPASRAGGRELWGIPKELADFTVEREGRTACRRATRDGQELAAVEVRRGTRLPGRWPLPMPTAQSLDGVEHVSPVRSSGRVHTATATWRFPTDGPLAFLAGRPPVGSVQLSDLALVFGTMPSGG